MRTLIGSAFLMIYSSMLRRQMELITPVFFFLPIWVDFSTLIQRLLEIRVDFFKKSTLMWRLLMMSGWIVLSDLMFFNTENKSIFLELDGTACFPILGVLIITKKAAKIPITAYKVSHFRPKCSVTEIAIRGPIANPILPPVTKTLIAILLPFSLNLPARAPISGWVKAKNIPPTNIKTNKEE